MWEYRWLVGDTIPVEELYVARFGLELLGEPGASTSASVAELAEIAATVPERVVDMFEAAHRDGALSWDPQRRMHIETRRGWMREYRDLLQAN